MASGKFCYDYPRPGVTVDTCIFALERHVPSILLIKRKNEPYEGSWALPGGYVDEDEDLAAAAHRELEEETGVTDQSIVQVGAYGKPGRDPRKHVISVAFMAFVASKESCKVAAGDDAAEAEWHALSELPELAFDHHDIVSDAWKRCEFVAGQNGAVVARDRATGVQLGEFEGFDLSKLPAVIKS